MSRNWLPPEPPRAHPGWVVVSLLVHGAMLALLLTLSGRAIRDASRSYLVSERAAPGPIVYIDLPYVSGGGGGQGPATGTGEQRRAVEPKPAPGAAAPGDGMALHIEPDSAPGPGIVAPTTGLGVGPGRRRLGAELGDGRVWVRPLDAIAAAIAGAGGEDDSVDAKTHVARIDSAIAARITAFLDTLGPDPMATPVPKPWVTEIAGQKWGVDGSWIYLGNLKLPTALLALLPVPQGNYEQAQKAAEMQRVRLDILQAARRAESAEEFKKYVKETRERRDAEREAKKSQETKPDSIKT